MQSLFVDGDVELTNQAAFEIVEAASVALECALQAGGIETQLMANAALGTAMLLHDELLSFSDDHSILRDRISAICESW